MTTNWRVVRRIKESFDWEGYIEEHYSFKYANGKNGRELRICCPSCKETGYKCYINPERAAFNCFKCRFKTGKKYDLFDFVALTEGISGGQALIRLVLAYKPVAPEVDPTPQDTQDEPVGDLFRPSSSLAFPPMKTLDGLPGACRPVRNSPTDEGWSYLSSRGFTEEDLSVTKAHFVAKRVSTVRGASGSYKGNLGRRVVFPVYGPEGKLVSWQGRLIDNDPQQLSLSAMPRPKYLTAPDSDLSSTVWPFARPHGDTAILVEGIIDALSVRRVPGASSYATFTKRISSAQIQILKVWEVKDVVLWFDKKDAMQEMQSAVEHLKMHFRDVYVLDLQGWASDKDAGDFLNEPDEVEKALRSRINVYSLEYERWKHSF